MRKEYDILIIGGGASGLFASSVISKLLAESRADNLPIPKIALLEKMHRPGRKINITGKGRCNLTNTRMWDEFSPHIHPNSNFFKSAFYSMSSASTISYFEGLSLPLTVERGQRVFPRSMRAMDVTDALVNSIERAGFVDIIPNCRVCGISSAEDTSHGRYRIDVELNGTDDVQKLTLSSDFVLLATGGLSYPSTGSTGDGYKFANSLGHTITPTYPSLTALIPKDYTKLNLAGLSLKNVGLALKIDDSVVQEEFGDLDFTSGGLEGSLGFRVSRKAVIALANKSRVAVVIDLKPALSEEKLTNRIISDISKLRAKYSGANLRHQLLRLLLPHAFVKYVYEKTANFTPEQLASFLKNIQLQIVDFVGYERAVVTAGGVSIKEVSPKTMESKLRQNLFFAGEILDIDGDTGGYNLQSAFSTANLAITTILHRFESTQKY